MSLSSPLALMTGLLIAANPLQGGDAKKDLEKLQGTWALVSAERDGKKAPPDEVKRTRITFKGNKFAFPDASGVGTSKQGTITIDPAKKPKWMDATAAADAGPGKLSLGIYEIAGYDYRVCFAPPGQARPKEFASRPGSGHIFQVWKRVKD
jgi:uncharacterized protein (TIGR03067 family)